jgi:hypothetical protein
MENENRKAIESLASQVLGYSVKLENLNTFQLAFFCDYVNGKEYQKNKVLEMRLNAYSLGQIASKLGINKMTASRAIKTA